MHEVGFASCWRKSHFQLTVWVNLSTNHRLEVYFDKQAHLGGKQTIDDKSEPAAVLRNLDKVLPTEQQDHRIVVIDRFYTSAALGLELLSNNTYAVGTIQTRCIGFPAELKEKRKKRPDDIVRGSYALAR